MAETIEAESKVKESGKAKQEEDLIAKEVDVK